MLLQFPSIAALSVLSFTSHALALSAGHARLHRHPAQAQRLEGRMLPRSDAPTIEVPVNLFHLLRSETAAFQEWMGVWLDSENTADATSSVALLRQEIQAYEGWMTAWLNAATSDDGPASIPPPPSIPVTLSTLPANSSQVLPTSSRSSQLDLPTASSSVAAASSSEEALPLGGEFFQLNQSVTRPSSHHNKPHTSFLTVTSQKIPAPAPTASPLTIAPVPTTSAAPSKTLTNTVGITKPTPTEPDGSTGFNALSERNLAVY